MDKIETNKNKQEISKEVYSPKPREEAKVISPLTEIKKRPKFQLKSLERKEKRIILPKNILNRQSRHHKVEALSNSMNLVPISIAESENYVQEEPVVIPKRKVLKKPPTETAKQTLSSKFALLFS